MSGTPLDRQDHRPALTGKIEKFEGKHAVIVTEGGQRLTWPIKDLPEALEVGSAVRLILSTATTDEEERQQLAKTILNEILK